MEVNQISRVATDFIIRGIGPVAGSNPANLPSPVWSTTGNDFGGSPYFVLPAEGVSATQRIGRKFNMRYLVLHFSVLLNDIDNADVGFGTDPVMPIFNYRVMIVKRKSPASNFITGLPGGNFATSTPIDARLFDIQFDKVYTVRSGTNFGWRNAGGYSVSGINIQSPERYFRFKIPLKMTVQYDTNVGAWLFQDDMCVSIVMNSPIISMGGVNYQQRGINDRALIVRNIYSKLYYTE